MQNQVSSHFMPVKAGKVNPVGFGTYIGAGLACVAWQPFCFVEKKNDDCSSINDSV